MTVLWPLTLKDARAHRYATWSKSRGYEYHEGYCTVAVPKDTPAFQCSDRIDTRSRGPQCRKHTQAVRAGSRAERAAPVEGPAPIEDAYGQQLQLIEAA